MSPVRRILLFAAATLVAGQAFALVGNDTRLGRDPEPGPHARVVLADDRVSRLHAAVATPRGVLEGSRSNSGAVPPL